MRLSAMSNWPPRVRRTSAMISADQSGRYSSGPSAKRNSVSRTGACTRTLASMTTAGRTAHAQPLFVLGIRWQNHRVVAPPSTSSRAKRLTAAWRARSRLVLYSSRADKVDATMRANHVIRQLTVFEHPHQERAQNTEDSRSSLGGEFVVSRDHGDGCSRFHVAGDLRQKSSFCRRSASQTFRALRLRSGSEWWDFAGGQQG